jgi:hypothetical protein
VSWSAPRWKWVSWFVVWVRAAPEVGVLVRAAPNMGVLVRGGARRDGGGCLRPWSVTEVGVLVRGPGGGCLGPCTTRSSI